MSLKLESNEIISYGLIVLFIIFAIIKSISTRKSKNNLKKPTTNEKNKALKIPFLAKQDDNLSSEFNGKSSREDSNPFEV